MSDRTAWFAGIDWASREHHVRLIDAAGKDRGEGRFAHGGDGLAAMADWLIRTAGVAAGDINAAIETPHGPVVETLLERGFNVYAINPKQLDRFRDRFSPSGAKDDSRDALVLASSLHTDARAFRKLEPAGAIETELRQYSRIAEELGAERIMLVNRLRQQLWRYFPAFLDLGGDLGSAFMLDLWLMAPTPAKAMRLRQASLERLLKRHRIRRFGPDEGLAILRRTPMTVMPGTVKAATGHIETLIPRIRLLNRQIAETETRLDALIASLDQPQADTAQPDLPQKQRDADILSSLPGMGRIVLATLLAEACDGLRSRDYNALRTLCGVAPVTKRSGKTCIVVRRHACNRRLANSLYHWARVAVQHDPKSRGKYAALRARGHTHGRALRSIADRLLNVACAMLKSGTLFDPDNQAKNTA